MKITSDRSGTNVMVVNITMKKGNNKAAATVFLDRITFGGSITYTMNGNIVPAEGSGVHVGMEKGGKTDHMNPFGTF